MNPPDQKAPSRHIPQLDGLRGLACLLILVQHAAQQFDAAPLSPLAYALAIFRLNWTGVDLFFVLSGYLLGGICLDHHASANYFRAFYTRRACRIFPLYYGWMLAVTGLAIAGALPADQLFKGETPYWTFWLYVQNFFIGLASSCPRWISLTWSLAIEEQFYMVLPALVWLIPKRLFPKALLVLIGSAAVCRFAIVFMDYSRAGNLNYYFTCTRWDALFIGVLTAWMVRQPHWLGRIQRNLPRIMLLAGFLAIVIVGISFGPIARHYVYCSVPLYSVIAVFYMCVLLLSLYHPWVSWAFRRQSLMFLGGISYGTYLFHEIVLHLTQECANRYWEPSHIQTLAVVSIAMVATMGLAFASYHLFERPIIRLGHRTNYASQVTR